MIKFLFIYLLDVNGKKIEKNKELTSTKPINLKIVSLHFKEK